MPPDVGYAETSSATRRDRSVPSPPIDLFFYTLERAMQSEKKVPENHAHTAAVGPPAARGADHVAGTVAISNWTLAQSDSICPRLKGADVPDPRTPIMEMAKERVLHLVNSRRNSYEALLELPLAMPLRQ